MTTFQIWVSIAANLAILGTFFVYWRQLKTMRGQLVASQEASKYQNLIAVIEFLQRPAFVEARRVLFSLDGTPDEKWNPEQRSSADRAIAGYDIVAILLRNGAIAPRNEIIIENWGNSIRLCYKAAEAYIRKARETRGENYWDDFEWLAEEANKLNKSPKTNRPSNVT